MVPPFGLPFNPVTQTLCGIACGIGVTLVRTKLPAGMLGGWEPRTRTILLDTRLNPRQERCALYHELLHAWYLDEPGPGAAQKEIRTRRLTAEGLVDRERLRKAEKIYGPDEWRLAVECDVTVAVLRDWEDLREGRCLHVGQPDFLLA